MIMLFEDNKEARISKLLRRPELSEWITDDSFSCGYGNLEEYVERIIASGNSVLCFHDVVPENTSIIQHYNNMVNTYRDYNNVVIIPIPCIEYYVLIALYKAYNIKDTRISALLSFAEYTINSFSYETYCKTIITTLYDYVCMHIMNNGGEFYTEPCLCDYHRKTCNDTNLYDKACLILNELPCTSCKIGNSHKISLTDALNKCRILYLHMWDKLSVHRHIDVNFSDLQWFDQ